MAGTVTVACRLPHGLVLQLQKEGIDTIPVMGGGTQEVKVWRKVGQIVTLKGWSHPSEVASENRIVNGFALTMGVDAEFMEAWMAQNADHPAVKTGNILVFTKGGDATSETRGRVKERTGFEPHNPKDPIPEFKRTVQTADAA
jgi:hypothetical protein